MFKKKGQNFSNHKAYVIRDEVMYVERVISADSDVVETETGIYKTDDAKRYYNETESAISYMFNVDIPSKMEAEKLKTLRRSTAIKNLFKYDTQKSFNFEKMIPWVIVVLTLLLK
ncbi:hypothetical protein COE95_17860 [Bacillus toyonensis]|uniref:hypothetical protein n=1 Tax=Bacillus toyonensis TaxID=155322 RepID=UPI000BFC426B|nr:hypothetical protein [Bacillus toyonensis]PHC29623.1 hypothetical protein COE95_17860 [Bacillus toyonensis]